jgi:hypothetical protein
VPFFCYCRACETSSLPGLTRQSISQQGFFDKMDHRVKPGDDGLYLTSRMRCPGNIGKRDPRRLTFLGVEWPFR